MNYHSVIPFWLNFSPDSEYGGFHHCFDEKGQIINTDKEIWIQGRFTWLLSWLAQSTEDKVFMDKLISEASLGAEFLMEYGISPSGRCYYLVSREGAPLRQRRYLFSEAFTALGLHSYGTVANDNRAIETSEILLETIQFFWIIPKNYPLRFAYGSEPPFQFHDNDTDQPLSTIQKKMY